jgi:hypothetical protein
MKTYTIEAKPEIESPEDWADILRPFRGVRLLRDFSDPSVGHFEVPDDVIEKVRMYLNEWYIIEEV